MPVPLNPVVFIRLGVDEALGSVYEHPALRDESAVLVVDLAIAPVGLGAHGLEPEARDENPGTTIHFIYGIIYNSTTLLELLVGGSFS